MIRFKYPNQMLPIPRFTRVVKEKKDLEAHRLALEQLRLAKDWGIEIDTDTIYEILDITKPATQDENKKIETKTAFEEKLTIADLAGGIEKFKLIGDIEMAQVLRTKLLTLLGVQSKSDANS